jgi:DNA-binding transcriptional ArsR family regulator
MGRATIPEKPPLPPPGPTSYADVFDVRAHLDCDTLTGRIEGEGLGRQIRRRLRALSAGEVLLVDFIGIRVTSYFALQETLAALCACVVGPFAEENYVVFRADEDNSDLFEALNIIGRQRRCVIPCVSSAHKWRLAGRLTQAERATLASLIEAGTLTAAQLQQRLRLPPSAASNRLRKLYQMRIVRREEHIRSVHGGREFIYMPLCAQIGGL